MKKNGKSFIQINIFGKTIEQMEKNGVDLKNILIKVGCDQIWIGDMPIYSDDSDSAFDNSLDESTLLLSTSLSDQRIPRCSTPEKPINMQNFSLCASKIFSRIKSYSSTVEFIDSHDDDEIDPDEIAHITSPEVIVNEHRKSVKLNSSSEFIPFSNSYEPPVGINPIENKYARIEQEGDGIRNLLDGMIDIVCETDSDDSSFYDCDTSLTSATSSTLIQLPTLCGPHPHNRHSEYIESVEMKPSIQTTKSLKNIKIGNIPAKFGERKPLKRTTSEKRITRRKAMKLIRNNSVHPILSSSPPQIMKPIKVSRELSEVFDANQDMFPIVNRSHNAIGALPCEFYEYADTSYVLTNLTPMKVQNEQSSMEEIEHSVQALSDDNETHEQHEYDQDEWHSYDEESRMNRENDDFNKECSSGDHQIVKKRKRRPKYNEKDAAARNSIHRIKCEYQGCDVEYNWRPKYGKLRLIDHCRKHCQTEWLCCNLCDFKTITLRGFQKHGIVKHPNQNTTESTVKGVLRTKIDQNQLKKTWDMCYKSNLNLVGKPNKMNKSSCE